MRSRRMLLSAGLLVVLAACGGDGGEASSTASLPSTSTATTLPPAPSTTAPSRDVTTTTAVPAGPSHGGIVTIGDDQAPPTLNPYAEGGDNYIVGLIAQALHTGVWDADASLQRIPDVVVELPTVGNGGLSINDDGTMTVRYRIRDEAQWADGTPISGDDFDFTYATLTGPELVDLQFGTFEDYGLIEPDSVEVGAKTFAYTMREATLAHE